MVRRAAGVVALAPATSGTARAQCWTEHELASLPTMADARWLEPADLDGDGDLDLDLALEASVPVIYENLGGGVLAAPVPFDDGGGSAEFYATVDLGNDGDLDLIVGSTFWGLHLVENLGGLTFAPAALLTATPVNAGHVHDMDGDGDGDLLLALFGGGYHVAWFENVGATFNGKHTVTKKLDVASDAVAADFDGDGDPDVLAAGGRTFVNAEDALTMYRNDGVGFGPLRSITGAVYERGYKALAFDATGDGMPDVAGIVRWGNIQASGDPQIVLYENDGPGVGFVPTLVVAREDAVEVRAGDVDEDGDQDLVAAYLDGVRWYENCLIAPPVDTGGPVDTAGPADTAGPVDTAAPPPPLAGGRSADGPSAETGAPAAGGCASTGVFGGWALVGLAGLLAGRRRA